MNVQKRRARAKWEGKGVCWDWPFSYAFSAFSSKHIRAKNTAYFFMILKPTMIFLISVVDMMVTLHCLMCEHVVIAPCVMGNL